MGRAGRRTVQRARGERGAAVVEYALGVALIGAVTVTGAQFLTDVTGAELQRKSSAGSPDLEEVYVESATTVVGTTTPEGPSTTVPAGRAVSVSSTGAGIVDHGQVWIATVTVSVVDSETGDFVPDAIVSGAWGGSHGGGSCITQSDGKCPLTLSDLKSQTTSAVTFTVTGVSGPGVSSFVLPPPITLVAP